MTTVPMSAFVHPQSGLRLIGVFVDLLKQRFSEDHALPWVYRDHAQTASILITTQGDPVTETASAATRVVIRRGTFGYSPLSIGDMDNRSVPAALSPGVEVVTYATQMTLSIDVIDQNLGAAEVVADIIAASIMGPRQALTRRLKLMALGPVVIQPGQRYEEDAAKWMVSVQFPLQQETTFVVQPLDTLMKETRIIAEDGDNVHTITVLVDR